MLRELASDLWVTEQPLRFAGVEMGTRMTVVRLASGELFLHSPVGLDAELRKELDALGPVRFAVAPNRFHHLFVGEVAAAYPGAELYAAPGLPARRADVQFHAVLTSDAPAGWAGEMDQLVFAPIKLFNEVLFCHRASRTLVMTDLSCNFHAPQPLSARIFIALMVPGTGLRPSRIERLLLRDRAAGRAAFEKILAWDFDRVVVAHGDVLESGGKEALRRGYRWLLEG
jgi:hypothetical protein